MPALNNSKGSLLFSSTTLLTNYPPHTPQQQPTSDRASDLLTGDASFNLAQAGGYSQHFRGFPWVTPN